MATEVHTWSTVAPAIDRNDDDHSDTEEEMWRAFNHGHQRCELGQLLRCSKSHFKALVSACEDVRSTCIPIPPSFASCVPLHHPLTFLHVAVLRGDPSLVRWLIDQFQLDPHHTPQTTTQHTTCDAVPCCLTPFQLAALVLSSATQYMEPTHFACPFEEKGYTGVGTYEYQHADTHDDREQGEPIGLGLLYAAARGHLSVLQSAPFSEMYKPRTCMRLYPIHCAAAHGNLDVIQWLLKTEKEEQDATKLQNQNLCSPTLDTLTGLSPAAHNNRQWALQWQQEQEDNTCNKDTTHNRASLHVTQPACDRFIAADPHIDTTRRVDKHDDGKQERKSEREQNSNSNSNCDFHSNAHTQINKLESQPLPTMANETNHNTTCTCVTSPLPPPTNLNKPKHTVTSALVLSPSSATTLPVSCCTHHTHHPHDPCSHQVGTELHARSGSGGLKQLSLVDSRGRTAVLYCAAYGHLELLQRLIEDNHCDIENVADNEKNNALLSASAAGHLHVAQWLVNGGNIRPHTRNQQDRSALLCATMFGHLPTVQWLVEELAMSPTDDMDEDGDNAFLCAAYFGHLDVLSYLVAHTPQLRSEGQNNTGSSNGHTALLYAAHFDHTSVVAWLLRNNIARLTETDNKGNTALLCAAMRGNLNTLKWLLVEAGADIHERNALGRTALITAAEKGQLPVVSSLLCEFEANVKDEDRQGCTPLLCAAVFGHLHVVKWLLKSPLNRKRPDINETNKFGRTALLLAASTGQLRVVRWLVKAFGDTVLAKKDRNGNNALHCSILHGHLQVVQWWVQKFGIGCLASQNSFGRNGLLCGCYGGNTQIVKYLVEVSTPRIPLSEVLDLNGDNPMQCAAKKRHLPLLKWMISNGVLCTPFMLEVRVMKELGLQYLLVPFRFKCFQQYPMQYCTIIKLLFWVQMQFGVLLPELWCCVAHFLRFDCFSHPMAEGAA
eukprot:TRINITY_DN65558_c0_g1_i1.p1 TRINITY_DN65558_c0_g1~~TRINITY_DN65558_c0_g1_i1.p1  ORF type:complete len:947 (-),score=59.90 TRINITY_DN65558_c0_g1_i1:1782-4622(-)